MSRPNTRNKNKRQRPSNAPCQILRKIHEADDMTDDDINQLFMIWKPVCQRCRVNTRDNPNCFCGLVPPANGSRETESIASDVLAGKCEEGMYYISKAWLQQWVKRKNHDAPSEADVGPTNPITCSHGELMPEQAPGAKRILVPDNFWSFLVEDALKVAPEDASGCPCSPLDSSQCCHCTEELSEVACLEDSLRTLKVNQCQNHEKLATGKGIPLPPQIRYFLLPSTWLGQWRSYINMTGKNSSSAPEPELLDGVINTFKCKKHTRLLERLPELVCRRGSYFQKNPSTDKLTIIPELDWKYLYEEWGGIMENGVSALIEDFPRGIYIIVYRISGEKDFMTRITKLEELENAANCFLSRFQQGLSLLKRPPIVTSSKLIENIIKNNETRWLKSYIGAGCINIHDAAQSTRASQSLLLELEHFTDEAAFAMKSASKFSTQLDKDSNDEENAAVPFTQEPEITEYATIIAVVYSMMKQNYAMQEKIVRSLSLKLSSK